MNRRLRKREYAQVCAHMRWLDLPGYVQELSAADTQFIPAFDFTGI